MMSVAMEDETVDEMTFHLCSATVLHDTASNPAYNENSKRADAK